MEFLEISALPLDPKQARVRRALELDADHGAATISLEAFREASLRGHLRNLDMLGPEMAWAVCVGMVFHLMWAHDGGQGDQSRTHPRPLTRWLSIQFSAEQGEMNFPGSVSRDVMLAGFGQVHRWWRIKSLPFVSTDLVHDALPELEALREDLRSLYPRIVELAANRAAEIDKRFCK